MSIRRPSGGREPSSGRKGYEPFILDGFTAKQMVERTGSGILTWQFYIRTGENPTRYLRIVFTDVTYVAGYSVGVADILGGYVTGISCIGGLIMLGCVDPNGAGGNLGHIYGYAAMDGPALYVSTVTTEAASGGTTVPSFRLVSDGYEIAAHSTYDTRFSGLMILVYEGS